MDLLHIKSSIIALEGDIVKYADFLAGGATAVVVCLAVLAGSYFLYRFLMRKYGINFKLAEKKDLLELEAQKLREQFSDWNIIVSNEVKSMNANGEFAEAAAALLAQHKEKPGLMSTLIVTNQEQWYMPMMYGELDEADVLGMQKALYELYEQLQTRFPFSSSEAQNVAS